MRRFASIWTVASLGLLLASVLAFGRASAQTIDEEPVGRLTIGGNIGVVLPSMSDVNDNFHVVNPFLNRDEIRNMDDINASLLTGLDLRLKLRDHLSIGFNWGAVAARSSIDVDRADVRFFSRATTYQANLYYHFPFIEAYSERTQLYVGAGLVFLRSGHVEWSLEDHTTNFFLVDGDISELSGKGVATADGNGYSFLVGGSFQLTTRFSIAVDTGYRFAKLDNLELQEVEGFRERFNIDQNDPTQDVFREPGDWAIWDFFFRDPNAQTNDGRRRTDPVVPGEEKTGCDGCPLYYGSGGPIEVDYSGPFTQVSFRVHF